LDADIDGSFEEMKWSVAGYSDTIKKVYFDSEDVSSKTNSLALAFEGNKVVWFGLAFKDEYATQEIYFKTIIPDEATHLSFFALVSFESASRSVLAVYIDDDIITYIDSTRSEMVKNVYRNFDINIKKYAGKTHTIRFIYWGTPQLSSNIDFVLLDYVAFIRDTSLGDKDYHPGEWPETEECAPGCQTKYTKDAQCDALCNNVMCGFDNGACEGQQNLVQRAHDSDQKAAICYSKQEVRKVEDNLDMCPMYQDETCCVFDREKSFVKKQLDTASKQCKIESRCKNVLNRLFCAACSPRTSEFYSGGKLLMCNDFASELYDLCSNSEFADNSTDECKVVYKSYTVLTFSQMFGDLGVAPHCFDGVDSGPTSPTVYIIIGAVAGVIVIAVIVVIIVVAVVNKKKKASQTTAVVGLDTIDPANNMTLVPVSMDQGGVIYMDEAGNVANGQQIVVVDGQSNMANLTMTGGMMPSMVSQPQMVNMVDSSNMVVDDPNDATMLQINK